MDQVFIIQGQMNKGKTHTCYFLYEQMAKYVASKTHWFYWIDYHRDYQDPAEPDQRWDFIQHKHRKYSSDDTTMLDFLAVLPIRDKNVVFISVGDEVEDVQKYIAEIEKHVQIDILICCARTLYRDNSVLQYITTEYSNYINPNTDIFALQHTQDTWNELYVADCIYQRLRQLLLLPPVEMLNIP